MIRRPGREIRAAHRVPRARELDPASSGLEKLGYLKLRLLSVRRLQHIGHVVPHPAHSNQSGSSSVERPMGASHDATGWTCEVADQAAHLVTLRSARRGRHWRSSEQSVEVAVNVCAKGLIDTRNVELCEAM